MTAGPGPAGTPLHWWTARELAAAIRRRELSAREVVAWHLDRIERVNPRINAIVSLRPEAALAEAEAADRAPAPASRSARCTGCRSPSRTSRTPRASARPMDRSPSPSTCPTATACWWRGSSGRGDHRGQDQHARVRRRVAHVQRGVRRHPQPVGARSLGRRQQRRGRRGAGRRPAADRRRVRPRRQHPQPGVVQQRRRPAADAGPGARQRRRATCGTPPRWWGRWRGRWATSR